jgi:hypothetical protein
MEATAIKFKDVKMFKDSSLTQQWKGVFEDEYDVEALGNKARVFSNNPFNKKPSRFAKLSLCGGNNETNIYQLIVNGNKVYFRIPYTLK